MANIIEITVKGTNELKPALEEAVRDAKASGTQAGDQFAKGLHDKIEDAVPGVVEDALDEGGQQGGEKAADAATGRLRDARGRFVAAGRDAGDGIGEGVGDTLRQRLPDDVETPLEDSGRKGGQKAGKAAGDGISPLIKAAFVTAAAAGPGALLTGTAAAVLGAGALITRSNAGLQTSYAQLGQDASDAITRATAPLIPALTQSVNVLDQGISKTGSELTAVFAAAAPQAAAYTKGLLSLADNALPGIATGLQAIAPYAGKIATDFGELGTGISGLFEGLSKGAAGGVTGLGAIIDLASHLLTDVGQITGALANGLGPALHDVDVVAVPVASALTDVVAALPPSAIQAAALATGALFAAFKIGAIAGVVEEGTSFLAFLGSATAAEAATATETGVLATALTGLNGVLDVALGPLGIAVVTFEAAKEAVDQFSGKNSGGGLAGVVKRQQDAKAAADAHTAALVRQAQSADSLTAALAAQLGTLHGSAEASAAATLASLGMADGSVRLTGALDRVLSGYADATAGGNGYEQVLKALNGDTENLIDAEAAFTIALAGVSDAAKANGHSLDLNTVSGARNVQAFTAVADSADKAAAAVFQNEKNTKGANTAFADADAKLKAEKDAFEAAAIKAGYNKQQVKALADELFKLPSDVSVDANVSPALQAVHDAVRTIDKTAAYIQVYATANNPGGGHQLLAHGGVVAATAAVGGGRGGLTWMNEQGPELVRLPSGSTVFSNPDSQRMLADALAGGGGGGALQVEWVGGQAGDEFLTWLRRNIRIRGGNVQSVLGR